MSLFEWWNTLDLALQVFYCIAIPSTLVLVIQTVLMFIGLDDGADGDFDIDAPDAELDGGVCDECGSDISDVSGIESLHIFTVRGIIAFLVAFGWVGVVMTEAKINLVITLLVATLCGFAIMVLVAYLFRSIMKLRSSGTADNRNALGKAGKVYLTIPANRRGEGKVNIMLQGSYVERNAVTDEGEAITTGSEVIVVGVSGQTTLIVKRK